MRQRNLLLIGQPITEKDNYNRRKTLEGKKMAKKQTNDQKIISAYYHSSSGGKTIQAGEVWDHDLPYIKSVDGFDYGIRKKGHGVGMSQHGANNLANKGFSARQILSYFYKDIGIKHHLNHLNPLHEIQ